MSRASPSSSRQLSLTEELEKLEQSITLTLQEIDHNFSRAHRIVTSSILPIVEQYSNHSRALWEGSKFWKQFFEASANVSLSGVEEQDDDDEGMSYAPSQENASSHADSTSQREDTLHADDLGHKTYDDPDDSLLDNGDISGSTPRPHRPRSFTDNEPNFADYSSPYEALKQELRGPADVQGENQVAPVTPGGQSRLPDMSMTPGSSPFDTTTYMQSSRKPGTDPLLHRVLDKNYRVHATPHALRKDVNTPKNKPSWRDTDSPMSSPQVAAPQLHADIFSSPIRQQYNKPHAPRTPEITAETPVKGRKSEISAHRATKDEISWESDSDDDADGIYRELGLSPPKTIQFSLPQSRLLQTPAREASKKIVRDLLTTAGAGLDDSDAFDESPSVVATGGNFDDSF